MFKLREKKILYLIILLIFGIALRLSSKHFLSEEYVDWFRFIVGLIIFVIGIFVLMQTAKIIEETTGVLSERTKIAGGLLQSFGTAFPDMVLGIVAALMSISIAKEDPTKSINLAIIAAATTFGSNIYNIAHAAWCVFRQNLANNKSIEVLMFPKLKHFGILKPMKDHINKPSIKEIDVSIDVSIALTIITAFVAISMVLFGRVLNTQANLDGDLYKLIRPIGIFVLLCCILVLYIFRKSERVKKLDNIEEEENYYRAKSNFFIILNLLLSGVAILLVAQAMVSSVDLFCEMFNIPFVVAGVLIGVIGCLGEMIVIHNFSVNSNGRIGDAIVGVSMDNIITICGASIIAIMGGIFLGGNALILIFVIILCFNSILIWQIAKLKNHFINK